jgi:tetratricopeptide (TPR) repeat protein
MSFNKHILFLSLYFSLHCSLLQANLTFEDKLQRIEHLRSANLFDTAISECENLIQGQYTESVDSTKRIHLLLGRSYFQNENYQKVIETLKNQCDTSDSKVLMSMAYNELKEYKEALNCLASLNLQDNETALYEWAFAKFYLNEFDEAKIVFNSLLNAKQEDLKFLSYIYLARIDLNNLSYEKGIGNLLELKKIIPQEHELFYELQFLLGQIYYESQEYTKAVDSFEKAIPKYQKQPIRPWMNDVSYQLGWSYLKAGKDLIAEENVKLQLFKKSEESFNRMNKDELYYLSLGVCYLNQAHVLKDTEAFQRASQILSNPELFLSDSVKTESHLLRAYATPSYLERDHLYRQLTTKKSEMTHFYAKSLYFKGLNDFAEGEALGFLKKTEEANLAFDKAIISLSEAVDFFKERDKTLAGLGLKYKAQAFAHQNTIESCLESSAILDAMIADHSILNAFTDPDEIYYLQTLVQCRLAEKNAEENTYHKSIEDAIQTNLTFYPNGKFADLSLHLLATFHYRNKNYSEAKNSFLKLTKDYPESLLVPDSLFKAALAIENQNDDPEIIKTLRKKIFTEFPSSKFADESYFLYFSYADYIQGDRLAIKHLESFAGLFPNSPFVLNAYYLLGMDDKRDRKSMEGKWIRKKNLNEAIDYFQLVEGTFDEFYQNGLISDEKLDYFLQIRFLAMLERGLANLQIAEESLKAKREIHLEYAQNVFLEIIENFKSSGSSYVKLMLNQEPYPRFQEESSYWLSVSYRHAKNHVAALKVLEDMIEKYNQLKITRGYFLSRVLYELGLIHLIEENFEISLSHFVKAEDAAKGKILNSEQKLDLWIQQSLCLKGLKQFDDAILILSKVINDDTISGLRVKAMYMRAEMYEAQGRKELSRRQLEATSKKGGEWALKAKNKLESEE